MMLENEQQLDSDVSSTDSLGSGGQEQGQEQLGQSSEMIDLDSVGKFKFQGKEWTPSDLRNAYMMQSDYTRKTQEIAGERKYYDNLEYDLEHVKNNPALASQFMSIYPAKFHKLLGYVTTGSQPAQRQTQTQQNNPQGVDPQFYQEFKQMKQEMEERKVQAIEAELDSKFSVLQKKYPLADEEAVLARAVNLVDKGQAMDDKLWDALWKSVNERNQKLAQQYYSTQVKQQKNANMKGRDVAPGGGTPGLAPKRPRTIKEASQFALDEIENS